MNYTITLTFDTDRALTEDEIDGLVVAAETQITDPADHTGESKRATFSTTNCVTTVI